MRLSDSIFNCISYTLSLHYNIHSQSFMTLITHNIFFLKRDDHIHKLFTYHNQGGLRSAIFPNQNSLIKYYLYQFMLPLCWNCPLCCNVRFFGFKINPTHSYIPCCLILLYPMVSDGVRFITQNWFGHTQVYETWLFITENFRSTINCHSEYPQLVTYTFGRFSCNLECNKLISEAWGLHSVLPLAEPGYRRIICVDNYSKYGAPLLTYFLCDWHQLTRLLSLVSVSAPVHWLVLSPIPLDRNSSRFVDHMWGVSPRFRM